MLSALVLLNSTSFAFGLHFCMGQLQNVALFGGADPCGMEQEKSPCSANTHRSDLEHQQLTQNGCCEDQSIVLEGSKEPGIVEIAFVPDFQMTAVLYALVSFIFTSPSIDYDSFNDYSPPVIERDIPVLVQSFLI